MKLLNGSLFSLKLAIVISLILTLMSCHKNVDIQYNNPSQNISVNVAEWFGKIKAAAKKALPENTGSISVQGKSISNPSSSNLRNAAAIANTIENLTVLEENLLFDKVVFTELSKNYNLIIIPINDAIKIKKHVSKEGILNLALVTDKTGKLLSGNIMCFFPSEKIRKDDFSSRLIADFLKGKPVNENGKIRVLSLTGRWLREFDFKSGKIVSTGSILSNDQLGKSVTNSNCIEWYLITTYHYSDGSTHQTSQYVGTTCDDCNNGDYQSLCSSGEGGGDGSSVPPLEDVEQYSESTGFVTPGGGGGGPYLNDYIVPPCTVRYKFVKHFETDYWGYVWTLSSVTVYNAEIVTPSIVFTTYNGDIGLAYFTTSNHFNNPVITSTLTCMVTWTYNLSVGVQINDLYLTSDYYTLSKSHTRVG